MDRPESDLPDLRLGLTHAMTSSRQATKTADLHRGQFPNG